MQTDPRDIAALERLYPGAYHYLVRQTLRRERDRLRARLDRGEEDTLNGLPGYLSRRVAELESLHHLDA